MTDHSHNEIGGHNPPITKKMLYDHIIRDHFHEKRKQKFIPEDFDFNFLVREHARYHKGLAPEYREEKSGGEV